MSFNEWKKGKLSDIAEIIMGQSPKGEFCNNEGNGEPLLNGPTEFGTHHPYPTQFTTDIKKSAKKGDLLFCVRGSTTGRMNWADREYAIGRGIASISPKNSKSAQFIKAILEIKLPELLQSATGSTFPNVSRGMLTDMPINIPTHGEILVIDKILSDLDNKIEVNNKINKRLEDIAQAIFKRWFVDFEFPNEQGKPYKSSGGEMVESELGMIPKGWEVKNLNDLCDLQKGLSYKGKHMDDSGTPMINLGNINPGGGYRKEKIKFYNGDYKDRHCVKPGDIVVANTDMTQDRVILGSPTIVPNFSTQDIIFTHHLFAFRKLQIEKTFLYYYLKSPSFRERAETYATGTTVLALSKDAVINIAIPVPNKILREMYEKVTTIIFRKIDNMNTEIDRLSNLRDTLLPKLMNGEIRVTIDK